MYRQCSPAGLSKKKFLTKNVDRWSECNKSLISSKYEIVLEREICLGVPISRFWYLFEATNQTRGSMKPPNIWNHETFETTSPMQTRNPWNHWNNELDEWITKPIYPWKPRNPSCYRKHIKPTAICHEAMDPSMICFTITKYIDLFLTTENSSFDLKNVLY